MAMDYLLKIEKSIEFIEANLQQRIRIEDVLENNYYSYPHFYRIFMDIVGDPMVFYIRRRRLSCAAMELVNTEKTILDIALDYNFSSQQTFNRAFTAYFGISPHKYRERGILEDYYAPFECKKNNTDLLPISVSIEKLEPMKIASCHLTRQVASDKNQERELDDLISKVWNTLIQWQMKMEYNRMYGITETLPPASKLGRFMIENQLHVPPHTRYFGFNNPYVRNDHEIGYEAWARIDDHTAEGMQGCGHGSIMEKEYEGGLYATAEASYGPDSNLDLVWKSLHYWLAEHPEYQYGDHQWLEEHLTVSGEGGFHGFKLYLPIKES